MEKREICHFFKPNQWKERCKCSLEEIHFSFKPQFQTGQVADKRLPPNKAGKEYILNNDSK